MQPRLPPLLRATSQNGMKWICPFIQGGGQDGGIIDYTFTITKYLGRLHNRDPEHANFETQCRYVFHTVFSCYKLTRKGACLHSILSLAIKNDGCAICSCWM